MIPGGHGAAKPVTAEITTLVGNVKGAVQTHLGKEFTIYEAKTFVQ